MKKLLIALLVLALPVIVQAQETYSISATAPQVTMVDGARVLTNRRACLHVGLVATCTQADVDAHEIPVGFSTPTIYADSVVGRAAFLRSILGPQILAMQDAVLAQQHQDYCDWFELAATTAQKNAVCSASGLPDGCTMCRNR